MPTTQHTIFRPRRTTGFTLTELMISVALALLLLVGINQVFKTTSQTVGTSYAALEGARKQVSIDNVFDRGIFGIADDRQVDPGGLYDLAKVLSLGRAIGGREDQAFGRSDIEELVKILVDLGMQGVGPQLARNTRSAPYIRVDNVNTVSHEVSHCSPIRCPGSPP